ncbi:MAG: CocE/NonD family hydrolase [Acidimicrobiia bacterium]
MSDPSSGGMEIDRDVPIPMDDGLVLRADVFRSSLEGTYPVILTMGPYGKGLAFQEGYPDQWGRLTRDHPEVLEGSTSAHQSWELPDPERWVPEGYVCLRVDSRGAGRSPGRLCPLSPRETRDLYECIEWAASQPWSNGRVGLSGISYYAINAWQVASLQPPHLAAMIPWEGAADFYRDMTHQGGILSTFWANWYDMQVKTVQHGVGDRGFRNPHSGEAVAGPETASDEELAERRCDFGGEIRSHPLDDDYHRQRSPDWSKVTVPFLSAGNWGGHGLHLRGNVEAYVRAGSRQKWLELHGLEHWTHYYTDYGWRIQKRFFDHFLKGVDNGWPAQPPVGIQVRKADGGFEERPESEWPLGRTRWTKLYLDAESRTLAPEPAPSAGRATYRAMAGGTTFSTSPLAQETEITGPVAAKLFVSSSTADADLFLVLGLLDREGREVVFQGAIDPHAPLGQGWLRASHRALDPELTTECRPYHTHDRVEPLVPGSVYELDVEIWPTSIVAPSGFRIALTVQGSDYEWEGETSEARIASFKNELRGSGPFLHDDPRDRPADVFGGEVTLHTGDEHPAYLLLPVIPGQEGAVG